MSSVIFGLVSVKFLVYMGCAVVVSYIVSVILVGLLGRWWGR